MNNSFYTKQYKGQYYHGHNTPNGSVVTATFNGDGVFKHQQVTNERAAKLLITKWLKEVN